MNEIVKNLVTVSILALSIQQSAIASTQKNDNPYGEKITVSNWYGAIANSHQPIIEQRFTEWLLKPENIKKAEKDINQTAVQMSLIEAVRYVEIWNGSVDKGYTQSKNFRTAFCQFGKAHGIIDVDAYKMTREEVQKRSTDWSRCDGNFQPELSNIKMGLEKDQWVHPGLQHIKRAN